MEEKEMYAFAKIEVKKSPEDLREMREHEKYLRSKPTDESLEETYQMLRDFGIRIKKSEIPEKETIGSLERWRLQVIKDYIRS